MGGLGSRVVRNRRGGVVGREEWDGWGRGGEKWEGWGWGRKGSVELE